MVKATGFESSFIDEWIGWNELDATSFQFYEAKLLEGVFGPSVDYSKRYCVVIELDQKTVELYDDNGRVYKASFELIVKEEDDGI